VILSGLQQWIFLFKSIDFIINKFHLSALKSDNSKFCILSALEEFSLDELAVLAYI